MIQADVADYSVLGYFRILVTADGRTADITLFRDVPTQVSNFSSSDPFGDEQLNLIFPQITSLDSLGEGDLWWAKPWAMVDLRWVPDRSLVESESAYNSLVTEWAGKWGWSGFMASFDRSTNSGGFQTNIACKGALYEVDNYLAKPVHPTRPIPYETLISSAFEQEGCRLNQLVIEYPDGWNVTVPRYPSSQQYLAPLNAIPGRKWTGLASRNTGQWQPYLTGYIEDLLGSMFTGSGGQWTLVNGRGGRTPILKVRPVVSSVGEDTLIVDVAAPGVEHSLSQDYTQSANVVYGYGTDYAGRGFGGTVPIPNSPEETVQYEPFAALPNVYPISEQSPEYDPSVPRKEVYQQFQDGITEVDAADVARQYLAKFSEPGWAGTITLKSDPLQGDETYPRMLIKAGMQIVLKNFNGLGKQILLHITEASVSVSETSVTLTVDSKFRDRLTVAEVMERNRDALSIRRKLELGKLQVPFEDYLKPWDYSKGAGIFPGGTKKNAKALFDRMPAGTPFPWTEYTTKYPPKKFPQYYIQIGPKSASSVFNWGYETDISAGNGAALAVPILMAEKGTISLSQFAAYDKDGNVLPVEFHLSIYGVQHYVGQMPHIPAGIGTQPYPVGSIYPMYPGAFEPLNENGTQKSEALSQLPPEYLMGWGNYYQPAGYSPGLKSSGHTKTGLLVDETDWSFAFNQQANWDLYNPRKNIESRVVGYAYAFVYCDTHSASESVYFLGRLFRKEPGT